MCKTPPTGAEIRNIETAYRGTMREWTQFRVSCPPAVGHIKLQMMREVPEEGRVEAGLLKVLADRLPAMLAYWDADLRCRFANRAYEKWFGVKPESMIGVRMEAFLGPLFQLNRPYIEGALRGQEQEFEREIPDPAGGPARYSQAHYIPDAAGGRVMGFCVLVVDITRRKRAEDALLQMERKLQAAERLAALSTLAAGIAHEINNPLASVLSSIELVLHQLDHLPTDTVSTRSALIDARDGAQRAADIVQSMKLLARGDTIQRGRIDVNEVLRQSVALASNVLRYRTRITLDQHHEADVLANASQLAQVFVNLLTNAAQAMVDSSAQRNEIHVTSANADGTVVIEVSDNGRGIPEELQARIFEPFFTTKGVGEGMGLGLSISNAIVKGFGGEISVRSQLGEGSTFRVSLPAEPGPPVAHLRRSMVPPPIRPSVAGDASGKDQLRLLVIDDEPSVARPVRRLLELMGCHVTVAQHGREAIALLTTGAPPFDLILCDLMMPELSGPEVFAQVTRAQPELAPRFAFMTGGAFTTETRNFLATVAAPVLEKPFEMAKLRELVDRAAAGRRAGS